MKTIIYERYGAPQVLQCKETEKPQPKENEILVKIVATAVNSGDCRLRKADPFAVRFLMGLTKPKINILGGVFSGRVEQIGKAVKRFKVGDEVFGSTDLRFGAYAEYKCVAEDSTVSLKPQNISHQESAAVPFGAATALHFVKKAGIKKGQKVLVYGASGAVGNAIVQIANFFGAEVTAVCSTGNVKWVKELGAYKVLDYTQEDFRKSDQKYDVVFDTVNKISLSDGLSVLNKGGKLVLSAAGFGQMIAGAFLSLFNSKKVLTGMTKQTQEDIEFIRTLVEQGALKPVIDRSYTLEEMAQAHEYVDKGHKKGNVVIAVSL